MLRQAPSLAAAALLFSVAASAAGPTIVAPTIITRSEGRRDADLKPDWINREDCDANDTWTFDVTMTGAVGSLEVWVGAGAKACWDGVSQTVDSTCWRVFTATAAGKSSVAVTIHVKDIVAQRVAATTTALTCDTATERQEFKLSFILIDAGVPKAMTPSTQLFGWDLEGPAAPTGVEAGIGEKALVVSWDAPTDSGALSGYRFYCASSGTASVSSAFGVDAAFGGVAGSFGAAGAAGTSGAAGAAGAAGGAGAAGAAGEAGAAGAAGVSGSGGAATDVDGGTEGFGTPGDPNPDCPARGLLPNTAPDEDLRCGKASADETKGETTALDNGVTYAFGVAAVDEVGNEGPLSTLACGTPEELTDFFEEYKKAGGQGGGGCSIDRSRASTASAATLASAGAALAFLLRMRSRKRPAKVARRNTSLL